MTHEEQVRLFLASVDQGEVQRVAAKYPCLSTRRVRLIRRKEVCVGLLGLAPARIPFAVARAYGYPSVYDERDK